LWNFARKNKDNRLKRLNKTLNKLTYLVENTKYSYSYSDLKDRYNEILNFSDEEFKTYLVKILHFTIFVCYLKELQTAQVLSDKGIIHEIVHYLEMGETTELRLVDLREQFKHDIKLV
jgi:hypothetical protein